MNWSDRICTCLLYTMIAVAALCVASIPFAIHADLKAKAACEARGGVFVAGRDISRCFAKEAFK